MNKWPYNLLFRFIAVSAGVLVVIQIIVANQLVGSGKDVRFADLSIDTLRAQNERLEQQIASASSLISIGSKAQAMGFIEPGKSQYLTISAGELPVAINNPR